MAQPRKINLDELARELSCTSAILADQAVTSSKLAPNAVTGSALAPGSVVLSLQVDSNSPIQDAIQFVSGTNVTLSQLGQVITISATGGSGTPGGATGAVQFNSSGSFGGDTSNLFWDSTNFRLGLGTNAPTVRLDVNGTVKATGVITTSLRLTTSPTAGYVLTSDSSGNGTWQLSTGGHTIEDEGSPLTQRTILNFVGAGVTVTDTGTETQVSIPQGGHTIEDHGTPVTQRGVLNFLGAGVTVTDGGTETDVTINGTATSYAKDLVTVSNTVTDHTISLSFTPSVNSEIVVWNGLVLKPGATKDYTISGSTVTLDAGIVLTIGDELEVVYAH